MGTSKLTGQGRPAGHIGCHAYVTPRRRDVGAESGLSRESSLSGGVSKGPVARPFVGVIRVTGIVKRELVEARGSAGAEQEGDVRSTARWHVARHFGGGIRGLGVRMDVWGAVSRSRGSHATTGRSPL